MPMRDEDTRITGSLPNLDIEIRRFDAGEGGEVVAIRLQATPNLQIALGSIVPALSFAAALSRPLPGGAASVHPLVAGPMMMWMQGMRLIWRPWLAALGAWSDPAPR